MSVLVQFQIRLDTAANWTSANPVLLAGESGLDTTAMRTKVGDGTTAWNSLAYNQNTVFAGTGAPSGTLGVNGDIYIDTTAAAQKLYGPKAAGSWGSGNSIVGAAGAPGSPGTPGSAGPGVVTGGTAGQYLRKIDATNYNTTWDTFDLGDLPTIPTNTFLGNNTGGTAAPTALSQTQVTALMNAASQTLQGMMSSLDKKLVDNLHYDLVADFGGVGNDSTINDTQFASAISTMPAGSALFIPSGTFRTSVAIDINVDRRFTFKGVNRYASVIKGTSATQHIFTKSVAGWYDMWTDLGFQTSVTKTAGAGINIPIGNNVGMNVYRCAFSGMFQAINATGNQSANLSVWADLDINTVPNGGRGLFINGATINVMIHNVTINAGAATTSACTEIQSSGAVQVTNCDWIQGTNVVLFNAASALGAQACYFTNCFFDQPQGSVVKIVGAFTQGRINFSQCGIAPTGNNHAVEVNGTGAGAVGTTTSLPAGVKFSSCDIYSSNGTNTGAGIRVNGCQDITVQNCNIAGFNGTGGAAIWITPSAGNQTKVRINGNILGPNSNLTITNATGVLLDAGASALGFLSITDNSMIGCGTAITDNSTILTTATKNINNNQGAIAGLSTSLGVAAGVTLATTEILLAQIYLPPNSCKIGSTFIAWLSGTATATTLTVSIRIGAAGANTDAALVSVTTAAMVAGGMLAQAVTAITAVGASAAHNGAITAESATAASTLAPTQSGTFNSTVGNYVSLFAKAGVSGPLVRAAALEIISPA
jgi:hypothetical protein